jgi:membrane fusion protein (multidrug efflux system)
MFQPSLPVSRPVWLISGLVVLLSACGGEIKAPPPAAAARAIEVITTPVQPVAWRDSIEALGTTGAKESVTITAKVTETVARVNFSDGDLAEAGQVLVDLTGRAEVAQLEESRAAFKEAQQQLDRQQGLVAAGTVARSQLDTQVAARDSARARMDAIRARLADRVITAPFDGVLGFRQVSPGTLVTPGTAIATLDDISVIKLDFSVPETFLGALAAGQQITARSAAWPGQDFAGVVTTVDSRIDPVTRSVQVRAEIPNAERRLRPGMLMTVQLFRPERQVLAIPELALMQIGSTAFVYRVDAEGMVEQVTVAIGARRRGEVEIVSGLQAGDRVIVEGTVKVRPGARVVEANAAAATPAASAGAAP